MLRGLDVSNHQKTVDWSALRDKYDLTFAFCKATEGIDFRDSYFQGNWCGIKDAGLIRGAYHFARPGDGTANKQVDYFLNMLSDIQSDDKLILDLETTELSAVETNTWAKNWASRVTGIIGRRPGIYTGSYLKNSTGSGFNQYFSFWWYPNYPSKYRPTTTFPDHIITPPSPNMWGSLPDIWQFTDQFDGRFDASVFNGTIEQLRSLGGDDIPVTDEEIEKIAKRSLKYIMEYVLPGTDVNVQTAITRAYKENYTLHGMIQDVTDLLSRMQR